MIQKDSLRAFERKDLPWLHDLRLSPVKVGPCLYFLDRKQDAAGYNPAFDSFRLTPSERVQHCLTNSSTAFRFVSGHCSNSLVNPRTSFERARPWILLSTTLGEDAMTLTEKPIPPPPDLEASEISPSSSSSHAPSFVEEDGMLCSWVSVVLPVQPKVRAISRYLFSASCGFWHCLSVAAHASHFARPVRSNIEGRDVEGVFEDVMYLNKPYNCPNYQVDNFRLRRQYRPQV